MLELGVLGPLSVLRDAEPIDVTRPLERRLLAILSVNMGRTLSDDLIIEALWPARLPGNPTRALQTSVSRLRSMLGGGGNQYIERVAGGYQLTRTHTRLDTQEFERLLDESDDDIESLTAALHLWRGDEAFGEFRSDQFAQIEADRLEDLRLSAHERLFSAKLRGGFGDEIISDVELMLKEHPLREGLYELLMRALYQSGRQAEALRVFRSAEKLLGEELGIEPSPRLADLEEQILLQDPRLASGSRQILRDNVPSRIAPVIGRQETIEGVLASLVAHRLVTLTGPGGVGKTTVAAEVARRLLGSGGRQVWFVDLSSTTGEELERHVAVSVATALQSKVPETGGALAIAELLGQRSIVLVLDNCEQVVPWLAPLVRTLLESASRLTVLATSRERLGIAGEQVAPLRPLDVPPQGAVGTSEELAVGYPALALLLDRIAAVSPEAFQEGSVPAAVRLCRRLDGLPLALELAAARAGTLTVEDIERQIDERFSVLGTQRGVADRHASLEAAMDWSHRLLSEDLQDRFQRLARMHGPFSLTDAACLFGGLDATATARVLAELQDRSIVVADPSAYPTTRFDMLGTLRDYGRVQGRTSGRADEHRRVHARCILALSRRASEGLSGGAMQLNWMNRVAESLKDFREAVSFLVESGDHAAALETAVGIAWYFLPYRRTDEGYALLAAALEAAGDVTHPSTPQAHLMAAMMSLIARPSPQALEIGRHHLDAAREAADVVGDEATRVEIEVFVAPSFWYGGDVERAQATIEKVRQRLDASRHPRAARYAAMSHGVIARGLGGSGLEYLREAVDLAREHEDHVVEAFSLAYMGAALREMGDYDGSSRAYRDSLVISARFGFPMMRTVAAAGWALASVLAGRMDEAREQAATSLRYAVEQPSSEGVRSYELLFIDPNLSIKPDVLRAQMAELPHMAADDQPTGVLCVLLGQYEDVAIRRLTEERVADVREALDRI